MKYKRVGLLGGTFNPPHDGYIKLAEIALQFLALDQVSFIPTAIPPHKRKLNGEEDGFIRVRLVAEAIATMDLPFTVELIEIERKGVSFTVETIEALSIRDPYCCWIFLISSDHLHDFYNWHKADRILELASLAITNRVGHTYSLLPDKLLNRLRHQWSGNPSELIMLPSVGLDLSSSSLRQGLSLGNIPKGISPRVIDAILHNGYYR